MSLLVPQNGDLPYGPPTVVSQPFWDGCSGKRLLFQRCAECRAANFPPATHCRNCLTPALAWEESRGNGRLYSWTVVHRPVTPEFRTPYAVAIVDLDEGYQMVTNVIGCRPDELRLEMALGVEFHPVSAALTLPYFRPTEV